MSRFTWVAYALAIGVWNTVFTGILVAIFNIAYTCVGHPLLSALDIALTYTLGYIALFALNIRIIDDDEL